VLVLKLSVEHTVLNTVVTGRLHPTSCWHLLLHHATLLLSHHLAWTTLDVGGEVGSSEGAVDVLKRLDWELGLSKDIIALFVPKISQKPTVLNTVVTGRLNPASWWHVMHRISHSHQVLLTALHLAWTALWHTHHHALATALLLLHAHHATTHAVLAHNLLHEHAFLLLHAHLTALWHAHHLLSWTALWHAHHLLSTHLWVLLETLLLHSRE